MTPLFRKLLGINWPLVLVVAGLLMFGVSSIYAATHHLEGENLTNKWNDQIRWIGIGVVVFFGATLIDYRWIRWGALPMYILSIVLLLSTNTELSGAESWLTIGGFTFQPSQVSIVAGILLLAVVLGDLPKLHRIFESSLLRLMIAGPIAALPCLIILLEPDFGSAVVWIAVFMVMLTVATVLFRYIIVLVELGLIVLPVLYFFGLKDYQKERIETWLSMLNDQPVDEQGAAWVPKHNMIAIGSAGRDGKIAWGSEADGEQPEALGARGVRGLRNQFWNRVRLALFQFTSKTTQTVSEDGEKLVKEVGFETKNGEKLVTEMGFVPPNVVINDFIFVTIAERQGFNGGLILISCFALLLLLLLFMAYHARDNLGQLIIAGFIAQVFFHAFMNIGMCVLLVPITGLPLPFISYGGTFVLMLLFMLGMCQSVWVHRHEQIEEKELEADPGRDVSILRPGLAKA